VSSDLAGEGFFLAEGGGSKPRTGRSSRFNVKPRGLETTGKERWKAGNTGAPVRRRSQRKPRGPRKKKGPPK